jgi:hypothetical protein
MLHARHFLLGRLDITSQLLLLLLLFRGSQMQPCNHTRYPIPHVKNSQFKSTKSFTDYY